MVKRARGGVISRWLRPMGAPAVGVFMPARATKVLERTATRQLLVVCAAYIALTAVLIVFLALWDASVGRVYVGPLDPMVAATEEASLTTAATDGVWEMRRRPLADAWREWREMGPIGPAEFIFSLSFALVSVGVAFLSWLYLPFVHRSGSAARSYRNAVRAVAASGGALMLAVLTAGWVIAWSNRRDRLGEYTLEQTPAVLLAGLAAIVLMVILRRIGRSAAVLTGDDSSPSLSAICAKCGYDLAYLPTVGNCPECGHGVADSLDPASRRGVGWESEERSRALLRWAATVSVLLFSPRAFYRRLRLRTSPEPASAFAWRVYVSIGLGAQLWWLVIMFGGWDDDELLTGLIMFGLWAPVLCWLGQRVIGALAASWWFYRGFLRDGHWAAKVILYEGAFLWVFCTFWGLLFASLDFWGLWISEFIRSRAPFARLGAPAEPMVLVGGSLALALFWFWRYSLILKSIRWSNH